MKALRHCAALIYVTMIVGFLWYGMWSVVHILEQPLVAAAVEQSQLKVVLYSAFLALWCCFMAGTITLVGDTIREATARFLGVESEKDNAATTSPAS